MDDTTDIGGRSCLAGSLLGRRPFRRRLVHGKHLDTQNVLAGLLAFCCNLTKRLSRHPKRN